MVDAAILERIRAALLDGRVRVSDHAFEELLNDSFHVVDAESAILTGQITRVQPVEPDHPGPRYTVLGFATDETSKLSIVCRLDSNETLIIITAFAS